MNAEQDISQLQSLRKQLSAELEHVIGEIVISKLGSAHGTGSKEHKDRKEKLETQIEEITQAIIYSSIKNEAEALSNEMRGLMESHNIATVKESIGRIEEELDRRQADGEQQIEQLMHLVDTASKTNNLVAPKLSILRPVVKLVDANLAYQYADLQSDLNSLLGFTTLFLGTFIAGCISLAISLMIPTDKVVVSIYSVVMIMSLIFSAILGVMAWQAYKEAVVARKKLEKDTEEVEITLQMGSASASIKDT